MKCTKDNSRNTVYIRGFQKFSCSFHGDFAKNFGNFFFARACVNVSILLVHVKRSAV